MCADLADVTGLLASMAAMAAPNGTGGATTIKIFEGWPPPHSMDVDMAAGNVVNVSIFPQPGASASVFQVLDEFYTIVAPVHGLSATISGAAITVSGTPGASEYLTILAGRQNAYSRIATDNPPSIATILSQIATDAGAGVSVNGNTITFPTSELEVLSGAPGTIGKVTHRQKDAIIVTIWAPNNALRNGVASAIDVALKQVNHLIFPDTSEGNLYFSHSHQMDERETVNIYRRDLIYDVEYATLAQFTAYQVTSVGVTIDAPTPGANPETFEMGPTPWVSS